MRAGRIAAGLGCVGAIMPCVIAHQITADGVKLPLVDIAEIIHQFDVADEVGAHLVGRQGKILFRSRAALGGLQPAGYRHLAAAAPLHSLEKVLQTGVDAVRIPNLGPVVIGLVVVPELLGDFFGSGGAYRAVKVIISVVHPQIQGIVEFAQGFPRPFFVFKYPGAQAGLLPDVFRMLLLLYAHPGIKIELVDFAGGAFDCFSASPKEDGGKNEYNDSSHFIVVRRCLVLAGTVP